MHKHGGDVYQYPNFTDFSANINLLGTPPKVLEQAKSAVDGILHYPQPGSGRLCRAVAELEQVKPEQVICGNGAADVIFPGAGRKAQTGIAVCAYLSGI